MSASPGLDLAVLVGCVGLYYLARELVLLATRRLNPAFYQQLRQDVARGLRPYAVFYLGALLTACTAPLCAAALAVTSPPPSPDGRRSLTDPGTVCLSARAVLWAAELPLLSYSPAYVVHHTLALGSLGLVILRGMDRRPLYLAYAGLATELLSDALAVLHHHGRSPASCRAARRLALALGPALLLVRAIPAAAAALYVATHGVVAGSSSSSRWDAGAYAAGLLLYAGFCATCAVQRLASAGVLRVVAAAPARIEVLRPRRVDVSVFRACLGAAAALAYLCAVAAFASGRGRRWGPMTPAEARGLAAAGVEVGVVGLVGARLAPGLLEGKREAGRKQARLSVQGGVAAAAAWLATTPTLPGSVDRAALLGAAVAVMPLAEAVGRVGCFFAGCCGSAVREGGGGARVPGLQILAAVLNLWVFSCVAAAGGGLAGIELACLAAAANAGVRLSMQPLRRRTKAALSSHDPYTVLASAQYLGAVAVWMTALVRPSSGRHPFGIVEAMQRVVCAQGPAAAGVVLVRQLWLSVTEAASRAKDGGGLAALLVRSLQRPIVLVSIAGGLVGGAALVGHLAPGLDANDQAPPPAGPPFSHSHAGILGGAALLLFVLPHVAL